MNQNKTLIAAILDKSGSMQPFAADTIGGFNQFLEDQRKLPGEADITVALFSSFNEFIILYNSENIQTCEGLNNKNYIPSGMTALFDAIGKTIDKIGAKLANTPEEDRPAKILILISTDGYNNDSKEYTLEQIKEKINHQREKYNWEFVFTAANIDAFEIGTNMGVSNNVNFTQANTRDVYTKSFSIATTSYRTKGSVDLGSSS